MRQCPVCGETLKETPKMGVNIDVCPRCRGVWLDRGELERLLSLAREYGHFEDGHGEERKLKDYKYPEQGHYPGYHQEGHYGKDLEFFKGYGHGKYGHKKKRGLLDFLEEIFD